MEFFLIVTYLFLIILFLSGFKVIGQSEAAVVERFGKFYKVLTPGLQFIIPLIDTIKPIRLQKLPKTFSGDIRPSYINVTKMDLRENVFYIPPKPFISMDNTQVIAGALLYFQIINPKKAAYEIADVAGGLESLVHFTLRNLIAQRAHSDVSAFQDALTQELTTILDEAVSSWGLKINRVILQNSQPTFSH